MIVLGFVYSSHNSVCAVQTSRAHYGRAGQLEIEPFPLGSQKIMVAQS
jgi:hypothetical protein